MSAEQDFCIYTANGRRHVVTARSLRTALRKLGKAEGEIIAACQASCMPVPSEDHPFLAVFLKSPYFTPPEGLG